MSDRESKLERLERLSNHFRNLWQGYGGSEVDLWLLSGINGGEFVWMSEDEVRRKYGYDPDIYLTSTAYWDKCQEAVRILRKWIVRWSMPGSAGRRN